MNTPPRRVAKNNAQKDFFKLINISRFRKTIENARKQRGTKLVKNKKNEETVCYHNIKVFHKNFVRLQKQIYISIWDCQCYKSVKV